MQIETEVTFLQMKKRPKGKKHPNSPPGFKLDIIQLSPPTIKNYRFLYNTVGGPWTWIERRLLKASGSQKFDKSILDSVDLLKLPPPMELLIRHPPYVVTILIQP